MKNDNSTVVYFTYENFSFLFYWRCFKRKRRRYNGKLQYKKMFPFIKMGQHESKKRTDSRLIKKINPKDSIISAGENNRYGHPNNEALKNLANSKIYRTDLDGSIEIKLNKNGYRIRTCPP